MTSERADLVIRNARVWSEGALRPGADAVAVRDGRVRALGPSHGLDAWIGEGTRVVDARGTTLTPGLTDAHIHLLEWARALDQIPLRDARSSDEVARRVERFAAARPGDEALIGRGWDENEWPVPPRRDALDRAAPRRPVLLHSHDFHALWVNGEALRRAGITRATPDPAGGRIERDSNGEPTGVLREHAVRLVAELLASEDDEADLERLGRASARLLAWGVTGVHSFEGPRAHRLARRLTGGAGSRVRVLMHLAHAGLDAAGELGLASGLGDDWFRVGAIKLFADGTLGSRTAAVFEPYAGSTDRGMELIGPAELRELVGRAASAGLAIAIHAIGDRAVAHALDAIEAAGERIRRPPLPPRIEHVQLIREADVARFAALGVIASLQPSHAVADRELVARAWPDRTDRAYPARSLLSAGARLALGADAPVEPPDPSLGLHAAVTRRAPGDPGVPWLAAQTLTLDQALTGYTEGPARAAGQWPRLGRIAIGSPADLVVWDADLHALQRDALALARPRLTVLEGQVVHEATEPAPKPAGRAIQVAS
ncbi:MAG TPA: amidohydrolase [Candidatus Sulfotelmatobacter sp.]|nr:amidohydrolase [Candidatus Sulfotelmatobacter sp.]